MCSRAFIRLIVFQITPQEIQIAVQFIKILPFQLSQLWKRSQLSGFLRIINAVPEHTLVNPITL